MAVLSTDLRSRVITAFEQTGNKSQVCRTFNIARTTLDDWIKLKERTGCKTACKTNQKSGINSVEF
jgi:transposase-like protein